MPGLPWPLLGHLAEAAGAHRFLNDGSQVMANAGLLPTDEAAASERLRMLAVVKTTGEEVAKAGRLEAYR